ncbi:MAG: L-ribulose-5-phosphate 4-epimerase [Christensenellales bacterium]
MLKELKKEVLAANLDLVKLGLVLFTWGNVSARDEKTGFVVIKPSGVPYETMTADDMVVLDMDGTIVEGDLNPSSDTPTHIEIYKAFKEIRAVVHTHSKWATSWAQACRAIPALGTTHADNFFGEIPCTRRMTKEEIKNDYEKNTGLVIIETFNDKGINPLDIGAVVVANHGPFSWGVSAAKAVENAAVMEYAAEMAFISVQINTKASMQNELLNKHFLRKHGSDAYYGQKE